MRLIIVVRQQAQISNRLVALSALMGHCIRNNIGMLVLSLGEYEPAFEIKANNPLLRVVFIPSLLHRLTVRLLNSRLSHALTRHLTWLNLLDNQHAWSEIDPARLRSQIWLINGSGDWCRNMPAIQDGEAPKIRQALSFQSQWQSQAQATSAQIRRGFDALVGIHARRGDYAIHQDGRWFYHEEDYLRWIQQIPPFFPLIPRERIRFVVCSNEPGFLAHTGEESITTSPMQSATGDQLLLAQCDLIIGPPSTFSVWAAFLSDTRLLHISARDQILHPSQIRRSTVFYDWRPNLEAQS
jgi:hypothetical protein